MPEEADLGAIYVELHPDTARGSFNQHTVAGRQVATSRLPRASATGRSDRAVQRDAERGEKIAPEILDRIAGTDEHACRALAEARSVDEAKDLRDKAEAARALYARHAKNSRSRARRHRDPHKGRAPARRGDRRAKAAKPVERAETASEDILERTEPFLVP